MGRGRKYRLRPFSFARPGEWHFQMANGIMTTMTLRVDKAGRVILPKPLRDRLGLHEGSTLELRETVEGVYLQPEAHRPSLVREGRFLVHAGALPRGYDIMQALHDDREDRDRKIFGL